MPETKTGCGEEEQAFNSSYRSWHNW